MKPQKDSKNNPSIQVYYNSACPICEKGIRWQKKKTTGNILWRNIDDDNQLVDDIGKELNLVRKYLHVAEGEQVYVGFDACIKLWESSPTETWKAKFFSIPVIRQVCNFLYFSLANLLYVWNKLCKHW